MDMKKEAEKRWRGHSSFQQELAEYVGYAVMATGPARVDAVADLVEFVLYEGMKHENKHCVTGSCLHFIDKQGDRVKDYKHYAEKGWVSDDRTKDGYPRGERGEMVRMSEGWYTGEEAGS